MQELDLALKMQSLIEGSSELEEGGTSMPSLMWVLRDFDQSLGSKTSHEYLESILHQTEDSKANEIRKSVRKVFSLRECYPLVHPTRGGDVTDISQLPYDSLEPEFRSTLESLVKRVISRPKMKTV